MYRLTNNRHEVDYIKCSLSCLNREPVMASRLVPSRLNPSYKDDRPPLTNASISWEQP
jgi:hypothetical protein